MLATGGGQTQVALVWSSAVRVLVRSHRPVGGFDCMKVARAGARCCRVRDSRLLMGGCHHLNERENEVLGCQQGGSEGNDIPTGRLEDVFHSATPARPICWRAMGGAYACLAARGRVVPLLG